MKLSNEVRLGMVIFAAVIVFVGGVIYLKGVDFQKREYTLTILYNNVNGLQEGNPITVAGMAVGKVQDLKLIGTAIAVTVQVQNKVQFPIDSKAFIKSSSLMGGKLIAITPGVDSAMLHNGDTLTGSYEADLTELTATLAPISSNVLGILERVNTTFDDKTRHNIQGILADVNHSSEELEHIIHAEGERLDFAIGNFGVFSSNLSRFALNLDTIALSQRTNLDTSMASIRVVAENLHQASENLKSTTQSLDVVLNKIQKGQGTLGKLVHEEKLYDDIDSLAWNLNLLVKDLRENPGRYVKVSVF
ncbi:MAG TPA: MlaD family protein [Bacteroidota bacterium]|nr:MlaD family protein [Bacteroidota bacterium]